MLDQNEMSTSPVATAAAAPKRRGRPPSKNKGIATTPAVQYDAAEFEDLMSVNTSVPKVKRKSPTESMRDLAATIGYAGVSPDLQAEAVTRLGDAVVQEIMSVCYNDEAAFYAHVVTLLAHSGDVPAGFTRDPYWSLSTEERVKMMDEAFAVQDDDAVLKDVKPGAFSCKKCGSRRVLQTERQLRSGDEAATQFFKCADCKHKWIIH
jgi:DNA-directed RNA polymerase subunit RPC12/RpoP